MPKKIIQIRNAICVLLILEFIVVMMGYLASKTAFMASLCMYVFIKNVICFFILILILVTVEKNRYRVKEAVNEDFEDVLIFSGTGLIQYDENRNISWTSELFEELNIHIVGQKLLEWQPLLASLFEDDDVKVIDIQSRKYEVYNSKETRLLYLKDVTDYRVLLKDYRDQQLCVAYITIDNYEDSMEHADEQKAAQIQSTMRQMILDWGKANGVILKRYKSDGYLAIFNERIYKKQVENKFNILDEFKQKAEEMEEVMTLSIGIGRGSKVLRELEEMAFSALSLAYSRGGDQVTVKSYNEKVRFFGGNSESLEKSNKVRSRVIGQSLQSLMKQSRNILVMGHKRSDFDSFGASLAVLAMGRAYDKEVKIIIDLESIEEKTSIVVKELMNDEKYRKCFITPSRIGEYSYEDTLLVIVDNHKPSLALSKSALELVKNKVVIDHHRRGEEFIEMPLLTYLEPSASSTVELLIELYDYADVDITLSECEATILYTGMLIDTNYFKTRVGTRTFQSAARLREMQANVIKAHEYLEDDYETTLKKLSLKQTAYPYHEGIIIAYGDDETIYDRTLLAKAGNELMAISDIKAVFVIAKSNKDKVAISARSGQDINVQLIMEKLGGGGHFTMAACQIDKEHVTEVKELLEKAIDEYLEERVK